MANKKETNNGRSTLVVMKIRGVLLLLGLVWASLVFFIHHTVGYEKAYGYPETGESFRWTLGLGGLSVCRHLRRPRRRCRAGTTLAVRSGLDRRSCAASGYQAVLLPCSAARRSRGPADLLRMGGGSLRPERSDAALANPVPGVTCDKWR